MKKSTLSVILLLVCVAAFLMTLYLGVDTFLAMLKLDEGDLSINESLPAGSVLGLTVAFSAILGGFALFEFLISLIGFVASLVNINIAEKRGYKDSFLRVFRVLFINYYPCRARRSAFV